MYIFRRRRAAFYTATHESSGIKSLQNFLSTVKNGSLGYSEINFFEKTTLDEEQIGYSVDANGKDLTTVQPGDWQHNWIVIATDELGDPLFADYSTEDLPVFTAPHGEGEWTAGMIASSLENFNDIIERLHKISHGRKTPTDLKREPIREREATEFLDAIKSANPGVSIEYWEGFVKE